MKRFISLMLIVICIVCLAAGCNDSDREGKGDATTTAGSTEATVVTDEFGSTVATTTADPATTTTGDPATTTTGGSPTSTTTGATTKDPDPWTKDY